MHRAARLGRCDVHVRVGEVGKATDVVEIEVGHHDVAHIGYLESELLDLLGRGFGLLKHRPSEMAERAYAGWVQAV